MMLYKEFFTENKHSKKKKFNAFMSFVIMLSLIMMGGFGLRQAKANDNEVFPWIILDAYNATADVGDEFYIYALATKGSKPSFTSSNSKIVTVNSNGLVVAKAAGSAIVRVKIKNAEACCNITVNKTTINVIKNISMENGYTYNLKATSNNGHKMTYKSSKSSVVTVDNKGIIASHKPGVAYVTVSCDGQNVKCKVTVKKPTLTVAEESISLYRGWAQSINAKSTSKSVIKFKSSNTSVATVDENGKVCGKKNGSANITVSCDGVSKIVKVKILKPEIKVDCTTVTLKKGTTKKINANVYSGNKPTWSSSNESIAVVDNNGNITAKKKGKCIIYVSEDGTKIKINVNVVE